ncbi:MAG: NFACT RNA binding domain-containing protein [Deltaproteobacteria bacterium]|jgi:predicted ribosome quality control (RQC) complex YloA/Tae2 family protein|nr:NFACT RNA binding domain-containing protein [Deltaproteobacteria bacterium]
MDAHVFRLLAKELTLFMHGARVEKIHAPAPGLFALGLYNHGLKRTVFIRHPKSCSPGLKPVADIRRGNFAPALYLSARKLPNPERPSAMVMTLRKYLAGRKLGSATLDWLNRRLFFFVPGPRQTVHITGNTGGVPLWLCLDLTTGPSLHHELPDIAPVSWPERHFSDQNPHGVLQEPTVWKNYPVLTPALRKTLACLDNLEAASLLADLQYEIERNSGEMHLYYFNNAPHVLSAWPLPKQLAEELREAPLTDASGGCAGQMRFPLLEWARSVYEPQVLAEIGAKDQKEHRRLFSAQESRLRKTLLKLDEEEERLKNLAALRNQGILLQSALWRLSPEEKNAKRAFLFIPGENSETTHEIILDPRKSILENMYYLFKQSERGLRGLNFVAERRKLLRTELALLQRESAFGIPGDVPLALGGAAPKGENSRPELSKNGKLIQSVVSSDGFTILRGRSALGNQALLKAARAHDLWLHVQGGPSAHVVIRRESLLQDIPERTLLEAGVLSAVKSWKKHDHKAEIITALVKDVRPVKGGAPGAVLVDAIKQGFMVTVDHALATRLTRAF